MIELTRQQIADLRGCIAGTVSNAHLPKLKSKGYDLLDPVVWAFVTEPTVKDEIDIFRRTMMDTLEDKSVDGLKAKDMETNILLKERKIRAMDLVHETNKNNLIPADLVGVWIGYFASGLRNNFLTIAARIARNNKTLRNKIEKEITKAINKTLETAKKELEKYSKEIMENMEEEE